MTEIQKKKKKKRTNQNRVTITSRQISSKFTKNNVQIAEINLKVSKAIDHELNK